MRCLKAWETPKNDENLVADQKARETRNTQEESLLGLRPCVVGERRGQFVSLKLQFIYLVEKSLVILLTAVVGLGSAASSSIRTPSHSATSPRPWNTRTLIGEP